MKIIVRFFRCFFMTIGVLFFVQTNQILRPMGMSAMAFKDVGACFKTGFELYAPMFGSMALSSGLIENLRFYNVDPGVDESGNRIWDKDKAPRNDSVMDIIKILFPSSGGQLTVEGTGSTNFGKLCTEKDVATLFNFVFAIRLRLKKKAQLPEKIDKIIQQINDNVPAKEMAEFQTKFKQTSGNQILLKIAKALEQERTDYAPQQKKGGGQVTKKKFYPQHFVEQIIGAFFCHKFAQQENLKNLLANLHDDIVDKSKIKNINKILSLEDLDPARNKVCTGDISLDDIWIVLNRENFSGTLPYKNDQNPISNGTAKMYSRFEPQDTIHNGYFADCVEVTIRHIMNFIFFDSSKNIFSLEKLDSFMQGKSQDFLTNLREFYDYQTPALANSGDAEARTKWNKVVADLGNGVEYLKKINDSDQANSNELNTGMLNFVRIFRTIFDLDLGEEPNFLDGKDNEFIEQVKKRTSNCLQKLFEGLCPQAVACDISYSEEKVLNSKDVTGNISVTIKKKDTSTNLFSFTIRILSQHIDIQDFKIFNQSGLGHLKVSERENIKNFLEKLNPNASFFLENDLKKDRSSIENPAYKLFGMPINDTNSRIAALDKCHDLFQENILNQDNEYIVRNILSNYLWLDDYSASAICKKIFQANQWSNSDLWVNQNFNDFIYKYIKTISLMNHSYIKTLNASQFPALKKLNLSGLNQFQSLSGASKSLEKIDLSRSSVETVDVSQFPALKKLNLSRCYGLQGLSGTSENLEEIDLSFTKVQTIDVSQFTKLKKLNLSQCNQFQSFSGRSENLEEIDLSSSWVKTVDVSQFTKLKKLNLFDCKKFQSLSGTSENLEEIDLSFTEVQTIDVSQFTKLKKLNLSHCRKFQSFSGTSESLEEIDLSSSSVKTVDVSQFPALKKLNLSGLNQFQSLSGTSKSLEEIDLSSSSVKTVDVSQFPALKKLDLSFCKELESFSGRSANLEEINLRSTKFDQS